MNAYLLDTCVISDGAKVDRFPALSSWIADQDDAALYLSVVTLGEIRYGIELLPDGTKRVALTHWLSHDLPDQFTGRVLPFDAAAADAWGIIRAHARSIGRPLETAPDGMLLGTARAQGMTLVTRNDRDVDGRGVPVLRPY